MVGREIEAVDFGASRAAGRACAAKSRNLSLPWPGHARGWRLKDISLRAAPRRDPGHRRADGGRADGAAGVPVRRQRRSRRTGESCCEGRPVTFRHPAEARRAGVALVTEDRKRLGLFAQMTVRREHHDLHAASRPARPG